MDKLGADEIANVDEWVAQAKDGQKVKRANAFGDRTPLYIQALVERGGEVDDRGLVWFGAGNIEIENQER